MSDWNRCVFCKPSRCHSVILVVVVGLILVSIRCNRRVDIAHVSGEFRAVYWEQRDEAGFDAGDDELGRDAEGDVESDERGGDAPITSAPRGDWPAGFVAVGSNPHPGDEAAGCEADEGQIELVLNEAERRNELRHKTAQAREHDPRAECEAKERPLAFTDRVLVRLVRESVRLRTLL